LYNHSLAKLKSLLQYTSSAYVKPLRHGAEDFVSLLNKGVLRISIAFKKSIDLAEFEPANLESNGKHVNH
jgi:hypothetical protein